MNNKHYTKFILILFSILVIPFGAVVSVGSGIEQGGGEELSQPQVVHSGERNLYQINKIYDISYELGRAEESENPNDSKWETVDIPVMATDYHEKNPSIETRDFGSMTPDIYVAAEYWDGTTSPDMIKVRRSPYYGAGPNWWDTGDTLSINSTYPLSTPKIKQASDDYMGVVFVSEYDSTDHDILYTSVNATDFSDATTYSIDTSVDDHVQPAFTSDYIDYGDDAYLYVIYHKVTGTTAQLLFRRSTDGGENWSAPTLLAEFTQGTVHCAIDYCADTLYVAYTFLSGSSDDIAVVKSSNRGSTWSLPTIIADSTTYNERFPEVAACTADNVFVVYEEVYVSTPDINYVYTSNGGSSWSYDYSLTYDNSSHPSIRAFKKGELEVYASYYKPPSQLIIRETVYTSPTSWSSELNIKNSAGDVSSADTLALLPKYSPTGDVSVGVAWVQTNYGYDIRFNADWLPCNPGTFSYLSPSNGETGVSINTNLDWEDNIEADFYDVYFGTTSPPPYVDTVATSEYSVGPLSLNTTYYWQVQAVNECGGEAGEDGTIWEFTTVAVMPDLIIESLTHSPENPSNLDLTTFTAVVKNAGGASAGSSTLQLKIGGESSPPTYAIPALDAEETHQIQRQETLSTPGDYMVTATADINSEVAEADETNNFETDTVSVHDAYGSLEVTIEPQGARDAGAQWRRICTSTWYDSGDTESGILEGEVIVEFKEILGWIKPANKTVTVVGEITTGITVAYIQVTGTGTFVDSGQALGSSYSYSLSLKDIDGDGDLDAFVANYNGGNKVWLNDANGIFTDSGQSLGSSNSHGVALGDVDCDGDLDAFIANFSNQANKVWLNDGSGSFTDSGQSLGASMSFDVSLDDIDGDGDLDAFIANGGSEANKVWLNDGSGNYSDSGQSLGSSSSYGVALKDLDGDGDLDAFVANYNEANKVWLNDGSGTFTDSGQSLGSAQSMAIALGDFDNDGDFDAFVANDNNQANKVWLNDGSGSFTDSGQNLGASSSYSICLGDVDGDGDLDAFVGNWGQADKVWLNDGSGNFSDSGQSLSSGTTGGVALGDLNGDCSLDAFVTNGSYQANKVWLNCIPPSIITHPQGQTVDYGTSVDLSVIASGTLLSYQWYRGDSGNTSTPVGADSDSYSTPNLTATTSYWVRVSSGCGSADSITATITVLPPEPEIDVLEGMNDIPDGGSHNFGDRVVGTYTDVTFTIENNGTAGLTLDGSPIIVLGGADPGQFSVEQQPTSPVDPGSSTSFIVRFSPTSEGYKSASISIGSNDADEHPYDITLEGTGLAVGSLIVNIEPQGAIDSGAQWKRLCTTTWYDSGFEESGLSEGRAIVEFKAIPGWLKPDDQVVSITVGGTEVLTGIYVQLSGAATFVDSGQSVGSESSYGAKLGDLDGDGDLDIFVANYTSQANEVWLNDGIGTFTDSGQSLGSGYSFCVTLEDIDNDGDLDAFVANDGPNKVWMNDGNGTFTDSGQSLGSGYSKGVRLGDVDCDGDLDAFIANHDEPNKVWLNDGSGTFTDSGQSLGNSKSMELAFGDLDGDGDLDVFVANAGNQPNRVWMNDGNGTFTNSGQSLASAWSLDVELGDLDGDGDLDAFVANSSTQPNKVWLNDGSGTFTDSGQSLGSSTSLDVELGDLDGDGDLDAFIANSSNQANKVWLNDGSGNFTDSGQNLGSSSSYGAALGRIDGDDSLDVVVANYYSQANKVWLNTCLLPEITEHPQSQTIDYNTTATLSVTASSSSPLSYQWYQGGSGDTSTPIGTDSGSYTTPNLTENTSYWVRVSNTCGSTDSDTATVYVAPAPFSNLSPADTSTDVALDSELDWEDSTGATSYDIYLGITSPPPYVASVTESYYDPGGLGACETYYWKIVARNDWGDVEGPEWSFDTILLTPQTFGNLSPANGATGVGLDADLDWEDSTGASSYDVYFGTGSPPSYADTVTGSYYDPGVLNSYTTYHWYVVANNSCGNVTGNEWSFETGGKLWTFMVYLDGDNNLESAGIDDFLEMSSVGSTSAINIVVQFDRIDGFSTSYGDWTTTKRFYITPGLTPDSGNEIEDLGELNHGDPQTLMNFISWAKENYPAERYALVLWNHGGGWRESKEKELQARLEHRDTPYYRAVCWDYTDSDDTLYMDEVQSALQSTEGSHLVGFDACLMGMVEVAYEIKDLSEVMVGSEETEPGDGWPYNTILQDLADNPGWSSSQLGQAIVDRYYESYGDDNTQSAIDLSSMDSLANTISSFAQSMMDNWDTDEDAVRSAAQDVMTEIENAVIHEQHGSIWPGAHGLALYFPDNSDDFDPDYNGDVIDFADETQWDEFLQEFFDAMGGSWIDEARAATQNFTYPEYIDLYDLCYRLTQRPDLYYIETQIPNEILGGGTAQGWQGGDACWSYPLPFDFPYFGEEIPAGTNIYIPTKGFIDFAVSSYDWTPTVAEFIQNKRIAILWTDLRTNGSAQPGEDIYITEDPGHLAIRWVGETYSEGEPVNFELVLYKNGLIQFNYDGGNDLASALLNPSIGISKGDGEYYNISVYNGQAVLTNVDSDLFSPVNCPPSAPANPNPPDLAMDASLETELDWDDCDCTTSYDVYFGTISPPPYRDTVSSSKFDPEPLDLGTTYYWKIVAKNIWGYETEGAEWQFTTCTSLPPEPTNPSPGHETTGNPMDTNLSWDAPGDVSSYDVYLGTSSPPEYITTVTENFYDPGPLIACTTYYWKIMTRNSCGMTEGPEWNFSTITVTPESFSNNSPSNGATDVSLDADLDWQDSVGAASYDVYLGTSSPPEYVATISESYYDPGELNSLTTYYWRIVAKNNCGETDGSEWHFTTGMKPWTFMVYLDGDNNLEGAGIDDFLEMSSIGSNATVNIVVQFDRIGGYSTSYGNWTSTKRFYITPGMTPAVDNALQDLGELNHGDPQTLINFINWAKENYPAHNYALVLWNHGGGWRLSKEEMKKQLAEGRKRLNFKAVCWDDTNGHDSLYMDEVQNALNATGGGNLIGFDACLMGMVEVAYEMRDLGEVMVGSEESEPGDGWPYGTILADLTNNPDWSPAELGSAIVDRYYESYGNDWTQSAIDLGNMDNLANTISDFGQTMINNWSSDPAAVKIAALSVVSEIENSVIHEQHGPSWRNARGLAVYLPLNSGSFDSDYNTVIDFSNDTQWNEFIQTFHSSMGGSWIAAMRQLTQDFAFPEHIDLYHFCSLLIVEEIDFYQNTQISHEYEGGGDAQGFQQDDGILTYSLPFAFPYFGETIPAGREIYICTNGYIDFENPVAEYANSVSRLANNKRIAPLWADLMTDGSAQAGEDIYITYNSGMSRDPDNLVIRWVAETYDSGEPVNFELILYDDGNIQFNYDGGNADLSSDLPTIGISKGDGINRRLSDYSGNTSLTNVDSDLYTLKELHTVSLDVEAGGGGTIFPLPGPHAYPVGQQITIAAVPDRYYDLDHWGGDLSGNQSPVTVTVNSDMNITANFFRVYPPSSLSVSQELNRTLLLGENINVLSWQDNPSNPSQKIANYNIYSDSGAGMSLLGTVTGEEGGLQYWHRDVDKTQTYDYAVCAVTTRGVEGEPSFRSIQGESTPETSGQTRSTMAAELKEAESGSERGKEIPVIIGPSSKETAQDKSRRTQGPLNFAAQRAYDHTIPDGAYANILSWQANPESKGIDKYRIYLVEGDKRKLLVELDGDMFEYVHREVEQNRPYKYVLIAVEKDKGECRPVYAEVK